MDAAETRLNRLLNLILETAVEALGFDAATISTRHPTGGLATVAATDHRMLELDEAQYRAAAGPCVSAIDDPDPFYLDDVSSGDEAWRLFGETAGHLGVRSTLSLHVPTGQNEVAASLNLYARRRLGLGLDEIDHAGRFAEQLAATLVSVDAYRSTATLARNMAEALRTRAVIEQAKSMLMAEQRIDADAAFEQLVKESQHTNVKLREVAKGMVEARSSP
jgi:GAF domain-containing protein